MWRLRRGTWGVWLVPPLWLAVVALSLAGSPLRPARELPSSQLLPAGLGDRVPGLRVADPDPPQPVAPPLAMACPSAFSADPGFAPWPSPAGAERAPRPRPVLPVAPKTSPPPAAA